MIINETNYVKVYVFYIHLYIFVWEVVMEKYVEIVNVKQAHLYIKNGLNPVQVYWGRDRVVYLFDKDKSKPLFDLWREHKLS